MRYPDLPDNRDRLTAASLQGRVAHLAVGAGKTVDVDQAVAELHTITTDPAILGHVLGIYLAMTEDGPGEYQTAAQVLRAAGADETTAQTMVVWQRERRGREQQPPFRFVAPGEPEG